MDDYIEIVNYDKTFQSSDYDSLLLNLDKLVVRIDNLSQELEKNKIEMEDLKPLLEALNSSVLAHRPIVVGFRKKHNKTGKYSWLAQRRDASKSLDAKRLLRLRNDAFYSHIETVPEESQYIDAPVLFLDPKVDGVVESTFRMKSSEYEDREKDSSGRIFLLRYYKNGHAGILSVPFRVWDAMRIYQYEGGTEKEIARAKKILEELDIPL